MSGNLKFVSIYALDRSDLNSVSNDELWELLERCHAYIESEGWEYDVSELENSLALIWNEIDRRTAP